jgi:porin-like protein
MKMVKSLLLGSAAGLVAVAGAQAADLPVKAQPVQYVKICSLYGAGFYYIPGTDMCIKVGGWVRFEAAYGTNGSSVATISSGDVNNRFTNNLWYRTRGYLTADARDQTAFGTVRGYIAIGLSGDNNVAFNSNRAFIQWAGFTFGLAQSFYDFYSSAAVGYFGWAQNNEDTGDAGAMVAAYTAQFGNGWSATLSAEASRATQIINVGAGVLAPPVFGANPVAGTIVGGGSFAPVGANWNGPGYGGWNVPDIVGNVRVDQAWGSAQIMGALHDVRPQYYAPNNDLSGNPDDKWGFVVGGGLKLNAPMFGKGDWFQAEVNYTQGALRYMMQSTGGGNWWISNGGTGAWTVASDAVFAGTAANGGDLNLTTGWSVNASYEHFWWNPAWRTSIYGGYEEVKYNDSANALLCALEGTGTAAGIQATGTFAAGTLVAVGGCSNNYNMATIGTRTQWNVTKDFYMGLDVAYGHLTSATTSNGLIPLRTIPGTTAAATTIGDRDNWGARFRIHRDFYP